MTQMAQMIDPDAVAAVFSRYPDVEAVYLFGSAAQGRLRADSDIDLAVVPRTGSCRERRLEMLTDLTRAGFDNIDLIFLDAHDVVLNYEAVRQNCLVYQTEDFDRGAMYSKVVRKYLDFSPYLEAQREAYKRRILHGEA